MPVAPSANHSTTRSRRAAVIAAMVLVLALTLPAAAVTGPTKLLDPAVSPTSATPTATISFGVTYRNREGSPPDYVRVVIDGVAHEMTGTGTSWKSGVRFSYATKLPLGTHAISFEGRDREKFVDTIAGASVVIAWPPSPTPTPAPTPKPTPAPTTGPSETEPPPSASPSSSPGSSDAPGPTDGPTAGSGAAPGADVPAPGPRRAGARSGSSSPTDSTDGTGGTGGTATGGSGGETGSGGSGDSGGSGGSGGSVGFGPGGGGTTDPWVAGGPDGPAPWALITLGATGSSTPGTGSEGNTPGPGGTNTWPGTAPGSADDPTTSDAGPLGLWSRAGGSVPDAGVPSAFAGALTSLGLDGGGLSSVPGFTVAVTTSGAVAIWMGFLVFGKRRRDGDPPESDESLAAGAARAGHRPASAELMTAPQTVPAVHDPEAGIPRWRRQSLLEARRADPLREPVFQVPNQTFSRGVAERADSSERRVIRYRLVRLLDAPDEFRAAEIGVLDQGDEIEVIETSGVYRLVRCPDGGQGWIHKMTLGDVVGDAPPPTAAQAWGQRPDADDRQNDGSILGSFIAGRSGA